MSISGALEHCRMRRLSSGIIFVCQLPAIYVIQTFETWYTLADTQKMDAMHLLPQHDIHRDTLVTAGLTRYPTTPGHVHVTLHSVGKLMSLPLMTFLDVMHTVRRISATLNSGFHTHRCGLTCDGSGIISLILLHGLSKQWKPIVHHEDEYCYAILVVVKDVDYFCYEL